MDNSPEKIGKYKLIREVGRGATATVYLAEHPQYPDPVALKLVRFRRQVQGRSQVEPAADEAPAGRA
jgi:non-specific serine/threonine protein kinase